jgi:hypothetical protein
VRPGFRAVFSLESQRSAAFCRSLRLLRLVNQRRLVSDAETDGSLARFQSAVVPLSGKGVCTKPLRGR